MPRYHVEFEVETLGEWNNQDHSPMLYNEKVGSGYNWMLGVPSDATITEIHSPVKVGDVLKTVAELNRAIPDTIGMTKNPESGAVDSWCKARIDDDWWRDGSDHQFDPDEVRFPMTVLYIPEDKDE